MKPNNDNMRILIFICLAWVLQCINAQTMPKWEKGYLDIHQISTRNGNASFIIFPDGTTVLVDAGDLNKDAFHERYPLKVSPSIPDSSYTTGRIIKNYVDKVCGKPVDSVDYFILTHFHSDHYGEVRDDSPLSPTQLYRQTGVTELGDKIVFRNFIVRDYPERASDLMNDTFTEKSFANLLKFIEYQKNQKGMKLLKVRAGALNQIRPFYDSIPRFSVRNIKTNNLVWTGVEESVKSLFPYGRFVEVGNYENSLSAAFVIQYGSFRYYFGGDNTGLQDQDHSEWFDCETPMAKVIGKVNVMVTNHHGNRDATNRTFIEKLDPEVVILPTWCSDQPGAEVGMRLISPNIGTHGRDIFVTYYQAETSVGIGSWFEDKIKSKRGHIAIRVFPNDNYKVYILEDETSELKIRSVYSY